MRAYTCLLAVAVLCCPAIASAAPETAVKKILQDQVQAWNRGDLESFCSIYAPEALFLSPSGVTRGREAVFQRYKKKYGAKKTESMGTLGIDPFAVRSYGKNSPAVTVAARWSLTWPGGKKSSGLTLIVFEPKGETWQIVQDASM